MSSFFNKLKPGVAAANAANNVSPNRKKDENAPELTPLEKMLQHAGPLPDDGTDRFFGLENFGNTCYCNSIVQALFYSESFRENVIRYPPSSSTDTPDGKPKKVNVQIRPPVSALAPNATPTGPAAAAAANRKPPPGQQVKPRSPMGPSQLPNGPTPVRPEDKPDSPEYKKKQAMIKGPVLELAQENASAYGMEECTFTGLKDIFMALMESGTRTGVLSPLRFLEIFRNENESFRNSMHQDAHEFYGLVLNDVIRTVEANAQRLQDREDARRKEALAQSMQVALANGSGHATKTPNDVQLLASSPDGTRTPGTGWVHDIFEGVLTSETRCLTCETASSREETFLDLSIDLDEHSSVTSCLRKFSAEEMLCERNKFHCDHCGGLQEAEKRMKIKRLPKVLALHLKRFKYAEDYTKLEKLFHRVVYPYQLRMFNTTDGTQEPDRMYELYAVVVHIGGNAYHGHYVAVIKTKERGWLLFDDEMVEPVDKDYVRNFFGDKPGTACAYVLFYQETTLEKVQAEQEAEGLEESKRATASQDESGDFPISASETAANHVNGGANGGISLLSRLAAQPAVAQVEDHEDLANLNHARTAPGAVMTPVSSVPPVPLLSSSYGASTMAGLHQAYPFASSGDKATDKHANAKAEAARLKEEKEREKKEAKAAEKARKAQEKENAKEVERLRKERELQRKSEAEELRKAIAASKQTAVEEREARKQSLDGGTSTSASTTTATTPTAKNSGFLNRSSRGSKSMSRRSFAFLGKDKDKDRPDLPTTFEHQPTTNGTAVNGSSNSSTAAAATGIPALPEVVDKTHDKHVHKDHRFSFSMGRKKSGSFMP